MHWLLLLLAVVWGIHRHQQLHLEKSLEAGAGAEGWVLSLQQQQLRLLSCSFPLFFPPSIALHHACAVSANHVMQAGAMGHQMQGHTHKP